MCHRVARLQAEFSTALGHTVAGPAVGAMCDDFIPP